MTKTKTEIKKKWSHTSLGTIFLLFFFFPAGLYSMWRYSNWRLKTKLLISGFFFLIAFLFSLVAKISDGERANINPPEAPREQTKQADVQKTTPTPTEVPKVEVPKPEVKKMTSLEKIEEVVKSKTGGVEPTIFSGNNIATNNNAPYNIVINFPFDHSISSCFGAKSVSHEILKSLYSNSLARGSIERVMVTIPYYLRVSLGSSDGVPMGEKDVFGGPTLFWQTLVDSTGYENESGKLMNRTWGVLLSRCQ